MAQRKPLTPVVTLSTPQGLAMQIQLMTGLVDLTSPADEDCSLQIADMPDLPGIAVLLKRQKSIPTSKPWIMDHDSEAGTYLYNAVFETESADEIVTAIKDLLELQAR
jgi:hypothetical protein